MYEAGPGSSSSGPHAKHRCSKKGVYTAETTQAPMDNSKSMVTEMIPVKFSGSQNKTKRHEQDEGICQKGE